MLRLLLQPRGRPSSVDPAPDLATTAGDALSRAIRIGETRHGEIQEAIKTADAKASLIVVLGAAFAAWSQDAAATPLLAAALGMLLVAVALAGAVVYPRRRPRRLRTTPASPVWWGAMLELSGEQITTHLVGQATDPAIYLAGLAAQLAATAQISHAKHRLLRCSLLAALAAAALQTVAVLLR